MSVYLITCGEPTAGESITINGSEWFYLEDPARMYRGPEDDSNTVAVLAATPAGVAEALKTGLLVDGITASRSGAVVTVVAVGVVAEDASFTSALAPPEPTLQTQLLADMENLFLSDDLAKAITIFREGSRNAYGRIAGESIETTAYVESGFKVVTDKTGQEVVASLFCIFRAEDVIGIDDEAEYLGRRYQVIDARPRAGAIEAWFKSIAG